MGKVTFWRLVFFESDEGVMMKLWMKHAIALVAGAFLGSILPQNSEALDAVMQYLSTLITNAACYALIPLVFFGAIIAYKSLSEGKLLLKTSLWSLAITVLSTAFLTFLGFLSVVIVNLPRVPIVAPSVKDAPTLGVLDALKAILPPSAFMVLLTPGYLLPPLVLSLFLGTALTSDKALFKPVIAFCDSASRLLYKIAQIATKVLCWAQIVLMATFVMKSKTAIESGTYTAIFVVLAADLLLVALVVYPLIVRFLCNDKRPYRVLYAALSSILTSVASGDYLFTMLVTLRNTNESLGVRRRINTTSVPIFMLFARGGCALVTLVSFIVIYHSYSSLAIKLTDILWATIVSFAISFALGAHSTGAAFLSLCVLCKFYGQGFEEGFVLLAPIAPVLSVAALLFDAVTSVFGTYIVAVKTRLVDHHPVAKFI